MLIFVSSFFSSTERDKKVTDTEFCIDTYRQTLEKNTADIVKSISGTKKVSVMITLDTGITYNYADETKFNKMCNELNHHEANHSEEYYYEIRNKDRDKNKFKKYWKCMSYYNCKSCCFY